MEDRQQLARFHWGANSFRLIGSVPSRSVQMLLLLFFYQPTDNVVQVRSQIVNDLPVTSDVLRMSKIVAQILQGLHKTFYFFARCESRPHAKRFVSGHNLPFVGKLQAVEQARTLTAVIPQVQQFLRFLQSACRKVSFPGIIGQQFCNELRDALLADSHQTK